MDANREQAAEAIQLYAYGLDTNQWEVATRSYSERVDVDYRAVGALSATLTKAELQDFLKQLLGKPDLKVHTAISQVLADPTDPSTFIAYYSVRHYKGQLGEAEKFVLFGWYDFRLTDGLISSIRVNVSATEGSPAVLA